MCDCDDDDGGFTFVVSRLGKFNNDGHIDGSIAAREVDGYVRFGQSVFMTDETSVVANRVRIGDSSSVFDVATNELFTSTASVIRGAHTGPLVLPLLDAECSIEPPIDCAGGPWEPVTVPPGTTLTNLPPGTYGALTVGDNAIVNLLDLGSYTFCGNMKIGNYAKLEPTQQVTINVSGDVRIGSGALLVCDAGPFILNVGGKIVRISQGAFVNAAITAPDAKIKIQRQGSIVGCTCSNSFTTDKHINLVCDGDAPPP